MKTARDAAREVMKRWNIGEAQPIEVLVELMAVAPSPTTGGPG